jgi:hypothetical protein
MSRCLAANYNVQLAELKISATERYRSQQLPRSMYASQEHESKDECKDAWTNANPKCESNYVFCLAIIVCNNIIS